MTIDLPTESEPVRIVEGDCLNWMPRLPDSFVDLILTDPPYHKVKGEAWDRQWKTDADYLAWLGRVADEWQRVLKPNGSLYCFASPQMAARVEVMLADRFAMLNHIVWAKPSGRWNAASKESLRGYFPSSERILFCERYGADNIAKGEAGYAAKCDELRGFVFEPLRAYLDGERERAGFNFEQVRQAVGCAAGSGLPSHWFTSSQWMLPTAENYAKLRAAFNRSGGEFLRREHEDLRREYEDLRRPFAVSADVPYTDVWTFPTVQARKGKHPCEKPWKMIRHMVRASSRPGAVVLDCFGGSGVTASVCATEGRRCILIEREPAYCEIARKRVEAAMCKTGLFEGVA